MSLIFKALKHNQPHPAGERRSSEPAPQNANVYSFRKLFSSLPVLLTVAVLLFGVGVLAAHGVQLLSGRMPPATPMPVAEPMPVVTAESPPVEEQMPPGPPPPSAIADQLPSDQSTPEAVPEAGGMDAGGAEWGVVTRFFPAEPDASPAHIAAESSEMVARPNTADPQVERFPATPAGPLSTAEHLSVTHPGHREVDKVSRTPVQGPPAQKDLLAALEPETVASPDSALAASNHSGNTAPDFPGRGRAQRHLQVARLAERAVGAIQAGDDALASDLLAQLADIKGVEDLFVLKLKAYWHVQQGRVDKARALLARVLARRPEDREAGLNLAVIEIRVGHHAAAHRRLERLRKLYPEDAAVADCLSRLDLQR